MVRVSVNGGKVDFFDEVAGDEVGSDLAARVVLLLLWHRISIITLHSYFKKVLVV